MREVPPTLRGAAVVEAAEAVIVAVATVASGVDTASGQSYQRSSGIALTLIGVGCVAALAAVALGLARGRRWTRTPALLTQVFTGIIGVYLLQSGRYSWGVPSVLLALAGIVALFSRPSMRVFSGEETPGAGPDGASGARAAAGPPDKDGKAGKAGNAGAREAPGRKKPPEPGAPGQPKAAGRKNAPGRQATRRRSGRP
jgi:hypothetical protein